MLTTAELFARRQLKLTEKKEMIAEIATLVIENPEENVCLMLNSFWETGGDGGIMACACRI